MTSRCAGLADLYALAPLFGAYRQLDTQPADATMAGAFLAERMERGKSVVLIAL